MSIELKHYKWVNGYLETNTLKFRNILDAKAYAIRQPHGTFKFYELDRLVEMFEKLEGDIKTLSHSYA